ncbi:NUDIX domain-containing protein [Candidatus Woesearchaeota archaeon]|nr:NUDIX domain-containing protein [Candidatus Woesearchaeota archaeon]
MPDFQIIVAGFVEKDGKILLVQEAEKKCYGKWNLPTGKLDQNETVEEGTIREVEEETGYRCSIRYLVGIYEYQKDGKHKFRMHYAMDVVSGKERSSSSEILAVKWFSKAEIDAMQASEFRNNSLKKMVEDYFNGQKHSKDIIQQVTQ